MSRSVIPPRALLNAMLFGGTLRAIGVSLHSLWLDEGATWSWATRPTWGGTVFAEANHPPAWWVVTRLWIGAFGDSEAALRAPAVLLGLAAVWLAWLVGLRLLDPAHAPARGGFDAEPDLGRGRNAAAWFAGLVAGSSFLVEYSQEARMYAALLAETLGLALLYLRWLDRGGRGTLAAYAALAAVALHTHYFALWPILANAAHALWVARRTRGAKAPVRPLPFLVSTAAAGLLFLPWFLWFLAHPQRIATGHPYDPFGRLLYVVWRFGAGPGLVVVDRARQAQGEAAVIAREWPTIVAVGVAWFVPLGIGAWALRRFRAAGSYVAVSLVLPVVLTLAAFPWVQLVHERYLAFLAPWALLVAVVGAATRPGALRPILLGGLVVLSVAGLVAYFGPSPRLVAQGTQGKVDGRVVPEAYAIDPDDPLTFLHHGHPYGKEPWRQAHGFVRQLARPGDLVCLAPEYLHLVWDYYDRRADAKDLPAVMTLPADARGEIRERFGTELRRHKRVFLVLAHEETPAPDDWFVALRAALVTLWVEDGASSVQVLPPVDFRRSWGVRVAVFDRP